MIYLDYSATTPVHPDVLKSFDQTCLNYIGNPNSLHRLGIEAKHLADQATKQIESLLGLTDHEVIYTSGASESNNLAIKGVCLRYQNRGKHILTTALEHSSVIGPLQYLQKQGFEVEFLPLLDSGQVDIEAFKQMIRDDTILVSVCSVDSELGTRQPVETLAKILKDYPKCTFHVDMTQSIGKVPITIQDIDLISFSAHKFYGLRGVGCLLRRKNLLIEPLIHGGKSTTAFRSGTPPLALIVSTAKALRLISEDLETHMIEIQRKKDRISQELSTYPMVRINSTDFSIPHILNFSLLSIKPETFVHALEEHEVYLSTKSACSSSNGASSSVFAITKDEQRASSSLRISLSYLTTDEEITKFLAIFQQCYRQLNLKE